MAVDSYKFLPRSMHAGYQTMPVTDEPAVWAPLPKPLEQCTVALMTSGGVYVEGQDGFDVEREKREPTWGDPTYRVIPRDVPQEKVRAAHLHLNTADMLEDVNVVLPFRAFGALEREGVIGKLADEAYSFMGYQDRRLEDWRNVQGPELARRLKERSVDVLLLAPA